MNAPDATDIPAQYTQALDELLFSYDEGAVFQQVLTKQTLQFQKRFLQQALLFGNALCLSESWNRSQFLSDTNNYNTEAGEMGLVEVYKASIKLKTFAEEVPAAWKLEEDWEYVDDLQNYVDDLQNDVDDLQKWWEILSISLDKLATTW